MRSGAPAGKPSPAAEDEGPPPQTLTGRHGAAAAVVASASGDSAPIAADGDGDEGGMQFMPPCRL